MTVGQNLIEIDSEIAQDIASLQKEARLKGDQQLIANELIRFGLTSLKLARYPDYDYQSW